MPKVIGVIQVKGGAGRSTLSTNLAGELSKVGKTVLIDGDMPQGTSASWFTVRQEATATNDLVSKLKTDTATTHKELLSKVELHQDADLAPGVDVRGHLVALVADEELRTLADRLRRATCGAGVA